MNIIRPTRAVLLAAGLGTRMRPLSRDLPKPLMPLWGRTLLDRALDRLARWGVRDVLINLHHGADEIRRHVAATPHPGLRIQFSFEPVILGTGGALRRAAWFLDEQPFWLLNADVAAELDPQPLLRDFQRHRPLATLWFVPDRGPRTVALRGGRIVNFSCAQPGTPGTFTFSGLHLLSPRILNFLPRREVFASIVPAYAAALQAGEQVRGVCVPRAWWADLGTPEQYLAAHRDFPGRPARATRRPGVTIRGFAALGQNVRLRPGVRLRDCVIWDGAVIQGNACVEEAVVGRGVTVAGPVRGTVVRAEHALDAAEQAALGDLGWPVKRTTALPLGARGSERTFTRLCCGAKSAILIRYNPARPENNLFARQARWLKAIGLHVPAILLDRPRQRLCVAEDLGDADLQRLARILPPTELKALYRRVLLAVLKLHARGAVAARRARLPLMPAFDAKLYRWERDYFAEHMLVNRAGLPPAAVMRIQRELAGIARKLARPEQVLVHRDLQSSNILVKRGQPYLIDFQGMRLGSAAYDLASLLCDPYAELPEALQQELLAFYARRADPAWAGAELFGWAAIQRLAQALGAYARLAAQTGLTHFAQYIPPALRMMERALNQTPGFPALRAWVTAQQIKEIIQ
ncbi:MAG: sugar phosphate nucleotidyltransferase [Kiritimatiellaeota bacterium]|nr:sugar phosphate nucleotidyltransferase [Kiritimatiellota bacterium]